MKKSRRSGSVLASMVLSPLFAGAATAQTAVDLLVREPAGVARRATVVRGGVPFARGELPTCAQARLQTADGRGVPCHVRPAAHWYDGSVKWLLVDALIDVPANGETRLQLLPNAAPAAPARAVQVTPAADAITVDSGAARFVFSTRAFGLPSAAWIDTDGDGSPETLVCPEPGEFVCEVEHTPPGPPQEENWLRDAAGGTRERFAAAPAGEYRAELETANPLHAVVKLSGWLVNAQGRRLIQYVVRAHVHAGSSELRILPTFIYAGNPKEDFIRTLYIRFPRRAAGAAAWAVGGAGRHDGSLTDTDRAMVNLVTIGPEKIYHLAPYTRDKTVHYTLLKDGEQVAAGAEAAGWVRVADAASATQMAGRNFWQMHPKELSLTRDALTFYIWPENGGKVLDLRRRSDEIDNVYHYDLTMWPYGGEGVAVTHELLLRYGPPAEDVAAAMSQRLNAPLLLAATPEYYAASNAFGPFAPAAPERYPHFEGVQNVIVEWIRHNQRTFHWDGMIDFGDTLFHGYATRSHYGYVCPQGWCSRGYVGWLCNDGTLCNSLFLQYLRNGDYETFLTAEAMVRHVMDVDTCHFCAAEPRYVGGGHRHDQQHWGNGVRGYGTATHGSIDYYLLTGDERALEVAREYAQYHTDGVTAENEDRIGGLIRMWEITRDPAMKKKADELLAAELDVPEDRPWKFATGSHFRFVSNTSVSLMHYLGSTSPEDSAGLRQAILDSMDARETQYLRTWEDPGYPTLILTALAYQATRDKRYALMTAALLQPARNFTPKNIPVPEGFLAHLRTLDFEGMLAVARQWRINNVYSANMYMLCPIPYALAALRDAGMDEKAVYEAPLDSALPPPFEEVLLTDKIQPWGKVEGKPSFAYVCHLKNGSPSDRGGRSQLQLLEDGKPLEPHQGHLQIMQEGGGRFSHWGARTVIFAPADNSDPRTNGREYKAIFPGAPQP